MEARLFAANLCDTDLTGSNMSGAFMTGGVRLDRSILVGVNMRGADMSGGLARNADFRVSFLR